MGVTVKAAAKINLMLDIIERLDNGYHSLWTVMQSVDLYDEIYVERTDKDIEVICSDKRLPGGKSNIAYKAAQSFFEFTQCGGGAKIKIDKKIPLAAGMAGGSADAAAVIAALNRVYEQDLSPKALNKIGFSVGSDVPFCIQGGTMLAQETGQVLSPLPDLPDCFIVIAKPEQGVSTKGAYTAFDYGCEKNKCRHTDRTGMLRAVLREDLIGVSNSLGNVFEQYIEVHERVPIKTVMRSHGCLGCCMSGSGPTVFGIFDDEKSAHNCKSQLGLFINEVFVCRPVDSGLSFLK